MASFSRWMKLAAFRYTTEIQWKWTQHHLMRRPGGGVPGEIETRGYVTNIHYSLWGFFFFLSQPTIRYFQTFACRCTRHQVSFTFTFSLRKCVWDTNLLLLINCKRAFKSQRSRSVFQSGPAFTVSDYFISFISSRHRFSAIYERPTPHPSSLTDHK